MKLFNNKLIFKNILYQRPSIHISLFLDIEEVNKFGFNTNIQTERKNDLFLI